MRLRVAAVTVIAFGLILIASGCSERSRFDVWFAQQGYTIKHEPVPCAAFPHNCGGTGQTDVVNKIIYLDDAKIAGLQATMPGVDVALWIEYHEKAHVADRAAGFVEGLGDAQLEWAAQCGAKLILGYSVSFFPQAVYWDCPAADLAKTRWIWTAFRII